MKEITRKAMIRLISTHSGVTAESNDDGSIEVAVGNDGEPETSSDTLEMDTEGLLRITDERIEIEYFETELTGMEGSCTCISFEHESRGLITMLRTGSVETALVFEENKRHICAYNTPYMAFEICVNTHEVVNNITENGGDMELDYSLEFRGASTERTNIKLIVNLTE